MRFLARQRPNEPEPVDGAAATAVTVPRGETPAPRRGSWAPVATRVLLHLGFLLVAVGCLAAYEHFRAEGRSSISLACLVAAAVFGFAPVRDVVRIVFGVERKALHLVHLLGGLGLVALPVTGVVSGAPVLTHAAMAPFALMGAAQAVMHQNRPRDASQAAALRRFAASLPEVAQFAGTKNFASPETARRAVAVLSDIIAKAQALGETELRADPGFQSAFRQVCTRFGAGLGMDAVELTLGKLAGNPGAAGAVPDLRRRLEQARATFRGDGRQAAR